MTSVKWLPWLSAIMFSGAVDSLGFSGFRKSQDGSKVCYLLGYDKEGSPC